MRTLVFGIAVAMALLAVPGALALADDVHVQAHVATADAPQAPAAPAVAPPTAPSVAVPDEKLPSGSQILEMASAHANGAAPPGVGLGAGAGGEAHASPGERLVSAVLPAVEKAGPPVLATAGVLALLNALGLGRFAAMGAIGLYSRLTKSELLDNEHRDRVYKLIQESPGLGVSEIGERSGLGWGTTVYHLDRLERAGFVASERGGIHKCYYPVGTVAREARKGLGALKADTTRSIAEFLLARPGATQTELCEALSLTPSAASKQVSKLETAGLVRRERDWKTVHLHPTEALPTLLSGANLAPPSVSVPVGAGAAPPLMPA